MNNAPLAQKYQYYLNESHRLNEELKVQKEYTQVLENVLTQILTEEQICTIHESLGKKIGAAALSAVCALGVGGCNKKSTIDSPVKPVTQEPIKLRPGVHAGVEGDMEASFGTPSAERGGAGATGRLDPTKPASKPASKPIKKTIKLPPGVHAGVEGELG